MSGGDGVAEGGGVADEPRFTFLTNHAHVLLALDADPDSRLRDVADLVGVTERRAQAIVKELDRTGYLRRERVGRRNRYELVPSRPLRHPLERHHDVGQLLSAVGHRRP